MAIARNGSAACSPDLASQVLCSGRGLRFREPQYCEERKLRIELRFYVIHKTPSVSKAIFDQTHICRLYGQIAKGEPDIPMEPFAWPRIKINDLH
jgi:hypothetical protein